MATVHRWMLYYAAYLVIYLIPLMILIVTAPWYIALLLAGLSMVYPLVLLITARRRLRGYAPKPAQKWLFEVLREASEALGVIKPIQKIKLIEGWGIGEVSGEMLIGENLTRVGYSEEERRSFVKFILMVHIASNKLKQSYFKVIAHAGIAFWIMLIIWVSYTYAPALPLAQITVIFMLILFLFNVDKVMEILTKLFYDQAALYVKLKAPKDYEIFMGLLREGVRVPEDRWFS